MEGYHKVGRKGSHKAQDSMSVASLLLSGLQRAHTRDCQNLKHTSIYLTNDTAGCFLVRGGCSDALPAWLSKALP